MISQSNTLLSQLTVYYTYNRIVKLAAFSQLTTNHFNTIDQLINAQLTFKNIAVGVHEHNRFSNQTTDTVEYVKHNVDYHADKHFEILFFSK